MNGENVIVIDGFATFIVIGLLAFLVESVVEYYFASIVDLIFGKKVDGDPRLERIRGIIMKALALATGIGLAFWYKYDLIYLIGQVVGAEVAQSWVGYLLTGTALARGAGYIHDLVKNFTNPAA